MRVQRADDIARMLSDNERWYSHSRGISMKTLREELKLEIDDLDQKPLVGELVREYHGLLRDFLSREQATAFMHTKDFF